MFTPQAQGHWTTRKRRFSGMGHWGTQGDLSAGWSTEMSTRTTFRSLSANTAGPGPNTVSKTRLSKVALTGTLTAGMTKTRWVQSGTGEAWSKRGVRGRSGISECPPPEARAGVMAGSAPGFQEPNPARKPQPVLKLLLLTDNYSHVLNYKICVTWYCIELTHFQTHSVSVLLLSSTLSVKGGSLHVRLYFKRQIITVLYFSIM